MDIVDLNGAFLPLTEAKISPMDRGFLYGDSVYEVIPVFNQQLFEFDAHIERLNTSLQAIALPLPCHDWQSLCQQIIIKNQIDFGSIYLQISRGTHERRCLNYPSENNPTVFIRSMQEGIGIDEPSHGIKAITVADIRWQLCHIKSTNLLANILLKNQALNQGAHEAIMLKNSIVTEGTSCNVFIVKSGTIMTPKKSKQIIGGVTKRTLMQLMKLHDIRCQEIDITEQSLLNADEVWISSSTRGVVPVLAINNQPVGNGEPGPMWRQVAKLYQARTEK